MIDSSFSNFAFYNNQMKIAETRNQNSNNKTKSHLSGNNFVNWLHPASHGLAFDSLQEEAEFRQQIWVTLEIVAVIVHPMSHNIQNSAQKKSQDKLMSIKSTNLLRYVNDA